MAEFADTEIEISLRSFDASIGAAYRDLFPGDPQKSPELLNWRFQSNPHGNARFAVASRDGHIVGMIALVPTQLRKAGDVSVGYQAIDTIVHPSCQGRGLFVKMGELAQDAEALGGDVIWGFPNANAAPGWYGRLGWTNLGAVPLMMRPLRTGYLFGRIHPKLRSIDFPVMRSRQARGEVYGDRAALCADFGDLWERVVPNIGIAVDRTGEWMSWRLFDKPASNYRCVGLKDAAGTLETFVATTVVDKHGGRLCYVMQAVSASPHSDDLAQLLLSELARAADHEAEVALAWCPKSAASYGAYRKAGFLPVPARLRPIEINFGAKALRPRGAGAAASNADWYLSFVDSDTN